VLLACLEESRALFVPVSGDKPLIAEQICASVIFRDSQKYQKICRSALRADETKHKGSVNHSDRLVASCHGRSNWIKLRPYSNCNQFSVRNFLGAAQRDEPEKKHKLLGKKDQFGTADNVFGLSLINSDFSRK